MPLFRSRLPIITIEPCLPGVAQTPPTGPDWIHEIKHDGFRIIARRDGKKVRLLSRKGKDLTYRFPLVVQAISELPVNSCIIDGEAIISDATGLAVFSLVRSYRNGPRATLCAFDLIEIDGEDLRWRTIEDRKGLLKRLIGNKHAGIAFNKHFDVEGSVVFHHACKLRMRRHRVEAARLAVSVRPIERLDQGEESGRAGRETRGRRGLEHLGQTVALRPSRRSRHLGPPKRLCLASSFATTTGKYSPSCIARMSLADEPPVTCSRVMKRGVLRRISPSCRSYCTRIDVGSLIQNG